MERLDQLESIVLNRSFNFLSEIDVEAHYVDLNVVPSLWNVHWQMQGRVEG